MSSIAYGRGLAHAQEHDHYQPQVLRQTPQEITRDVLEETARVTRRYKMIVAVLVGLFGLGVTGFVLRLVDVGGFDELSPWAYLMVGYAFLLTTASSAPLFSVTQRMVKSHWRLPMARVSEMFAVVGVLSTLMFIPLILLLPSSASRVSIWFEWPGTPLWPQLASVVFLMVNGLGILYATLLPDLARERDHGSGFRQKLGARLSGFWVGTPRQWKVLKAAIGVLGALYFMGLIMVHTFISADFAMVLVPGWRDALFPCFQALHGLQGAVATTIIAMFIVAKFTGLKEYVSVDFFWGASKILLALSLLWAYFFFTEFIVFWYGRQPVEQEILKTFMFNSYRWPFVAAIFLCWLIPFLTLLWNFARKSMVFPTIAATSAVIGVLADKIRIYPGAFSIADKERDEVFGHIHPERLAEAPQALWPSGPDVLMLIGVIAGAILIYMIAIKIVPMLSIWELSEGTLYRKRRRFLKRDILVMGKPE